MLQTPRARQAMRWVLPLAVFAVARLVSAVFLAHAAQVQPDLTAAADWHVEDSRPASPSYWKILSNWDGQWFETIARHGYTGIETGDRPRQNALAFSPLYPFLVRAVMTLSGLSFEVAASLVSLAAGAAAMVLLFRWIERTRGAGPAVAAVAVLSFFPSAPILQSAYSDSLALLLIVVALRAVVDRHWPVVLLVAALLAFTRPVLLPVAAFIALIEWRRAADPTQRATASRAALATAVVVVVLAFAWPVTAGVISGDLAAWFTSNAAWRMDGRALGGWFTGMWAAGLGLLSILMGLLLAALLALRWRHRFEVRTPDQLGTWAAIYLLYMIVTAPPSAGIVRHALLTLVPLGTAGPMAATVGRRRRAVLLSAVVLVELGLQWLWVRHVFVVDDPSSARIP